MTLRERQVENLAKHSFDVLIIGGGINGAVSAAALSAHGVKVALIDSRDFAGFTSQQSSNLVWGGIKYMESYEFGLVANLCKARNELMRSFPSVVREIRFLTTLSKTFRYHPLMMLAGSWLYWLFGRGYTKPPKLFSARKIGAIEPVINITNSRGGIEYSDAYLFDNDARFVFNFIRSAMCNGCIAANYVESLGAKRDPDNRWITEAVDKTSAQTLQIRSRAIINASGPFVDKHNNLSAVKTEHKHVFSKGIHLIVPRITDNNRVLAFFADDGRLFFAIPMAHCTCIGTTDTWVDDPGTSITDEDRDFVLSNINTRLNLPSPLAYKDIIAERCGVRPLAVAAGADIGNDFLHLSRKHVIETTDDNSHISIYGGKLTDCLNVGEEICELIAELEISLSKPDHKWYGEPNQTIRADYERQAKALELDRIIASDTGETVAARLWRRYDMDAIDMLEEIKSDSTLLEPVVPGAGVRRCEVFYAAKHEMIVKLEDFLRRRSKIALVVRRKALREAQGLREACRILFGEAAQDKFDEYFVGNNSAGET